MAINSLLYDTNANGHFVGAHGLEKRAGADGLSLMLLKLWLIRITVVLAFLCQTVGVSSASNGNPLQGRIQNHYSPYDKKRAIRPHTRYIVLHTTEGQDKGSLRVVTRSGLAHYFVSEAGRVYRIIHKSKIAKHAGVSMWEGLAEIDNYSIGIEVSGYHDRDITDAQYEVLRELIRQLQSLYDIPDEDVITHSMVAYGRPNYKNKSNWRGRKRCGMLFAKPEVRARLGLEAAPERDPDVAAGRMKVGDRELFKVLFPDKPGSTSVVASAKPATVKMPPTAADEPLTTADNRRPVTEEPLRIADNREPVTNEPLTTADNGRPVTEEPPATADNREPVTEEPLRIADNREPAADDRSLTTSVAEKIVPLSMKSVSSETEPKSYLIGRKQTAWDVAGESYNLSSTLYIFPNGKKTTGSQITDWSQIPANTRVILEAENTGQFEGFLEVGKHGHTAKEVAGTASTSSTTIYFFPDGFIRTGAELNSRRSYQKLLNNPPKETKVLLGYVYGGYVMGRRPPYSIAGVKWNYPSTYYRYPDGRFVNGDDINDREIPPGTLVFYQR